MNENIDTTITPLQEKPLIHHVFFWLVRPGAVDDQQLLMEGIRSLAVIPVVQQFYVGIAAGTALREVIDNTYDVSLMLIFNNEIDQEIYQQHPIHVAFVEKYNHLWQKVLVYDVQTV